MIRMYSLGELISRTHNDKTQIPTFLNLLKLDFQKIANMNNIHDDRIPLCQDLKSFDRILRQHRVCVEQLTIPETMIKQSQTIQAMLYEGERRNANTWFISVDLGKENILNELVYYAALKIFFNLCKRYQLTNDIQVSNLRAEFTLKFEKVIHAFSLTLQNNINLAYRHAVQQLLSQINYQKDIPWSGNKARILTNVFNDIFYASLCSYGLCPDAFYQLNEYNWMYRKYFGHTTSEKTQEVDSPETLSPLTLD